MSRRPFSFYLRHAFHFHRQTGRRSRVLWGLLLCLIVLASPLPAHAVSQIDINGPAGSGRFGQTVTLLPNGNLVVTDPTFSKGVNPRVGAVYLYNGASGALLSTLTGSTPEDQVGSAGVMVLSNGNYVVLSPAWSNGGAAAGAVTWGSGVTGVTGVVSAANSLVGSTAGDNVGFYAIVLNNGNYVVGSPYWHNGAVANAGAVTWGDGATGVTGIVAASNSLVGGTADDRVGFYMAPLASGNYVVTSPNWHNGAGANVGAVTWGNGATGINGLINSSNSLVGSTTGDQVGIGVTLLSNGNYVVRSSAWDNGAMADVGAVTWGSGVSGISGTVNATNSLVGSTAGDLVGYVIALSNGNYVILSPAWSNGAAANAGAATWGNGTTGVSGVVNSSNSLVGATADDQVGSAGVTALNNGNYVVDSPNWHNGAAAGAGAVTWGNGMSGVSGVVNATNSLVGATAGDLAGNGLVTVLKNGNYLVNSPHWHNGIAADAGAVTWGSGTTGVNGIISNSNSLVGVTADDLVGSFAPTALSNGNYVVLAPNWDNGATANVGAATWGNGATGSSGVVNAANSLVGATAEDQVGSRGATALSNGNYVVLSPLWQNGATANAGAVTWMAGAASNSGLVNSTNSLVGSTTGDQVGGNGVTALSNGNYVVASPA